jgi:hypothetical protein
MPLPPNTSTQVIMPLTGLSLIRPRMVNGSYVTEREKIQLTRTEFKPVSPDITIQRLCQLTLKLYVPIYLYFQNE